MAYQWAILTCKATLLPTAVGLVVSYAAGHLAARYTALSVGRLLETTSRITHRTRD